MSRKNRRKPKPPSIHRRTGPGAAPGTIVVDPAAPRSQVSLLAYGPDRLVEKQIHDLDELQGCTAQWPVTWVNVNGLGDERVIQEIGRLFGLHSLALEDVVNVHQRAKVEEYGPQQFIVARMVERKEGLQTEQISLFLGQNFVVSFQERPGKDSIEPVRERLRRGYARLRASGADYLVYSILDAIIDGYFPVLEQYSEVLDSIEEDVTDRPDRHTLSRLHDIKAELLLVRRAIWPLREAISVLVRDPSPLVTNETRIYLRDCYDHTVQLIDLIETYRELGADLRDLYMSSVSNRMNEIMKVLTIISTLFMPLSFIAGYYGMNFKWFPEVEWPWGLPMAIGLMLAVAGGMLLFFRSKGWIGPGARPPKE